MERMTPMELLRLLEAESSTLGVLQSKISNQLHWLKVEEDMLIRKLNNPEYGTTAPSESDEEGRELIEIIEAGSENDDQELQNSGVEQMTTRALEETEDTFETNETEEELEAELLNELLNEDMNSLQEPSPPKKMTTRRQGKQKTIDVGDEEDDLETEFHAQENNVTGFHPTALLESPLSLQSTPPQKRKIRG